MTFSEGVRPRPRVLVVDDDPETLRQLSSVVRWGYETIQALPPPDTLRQLEADWPDLVLLDPASRGARELAIAIKERADIPIIALSRDASIEAKVQAIRSYAEDYVTKPFDVGELLARIDRVLYRMRGRLPAKGLRLSSDVTLLLTQSAAIVRGRAVPLGPLQTVASRICWKSADGTGSSALVG
jgi:DNA-binding response OmpR family regulator